MDQAMAIAAEYVHIADQYPVLTTTEREIAAAIRDTNNMFFSNAAFTSGSDSARTSSSSDSSATRHELSSADIAQSFDFIEKTLPMPIHSTRSHRAHSQSTTCNTNIDSLYGSVAMTSKITKQTHVDERPRALSKIKHSIKRHGRNLRSVFS
ncbi:hypothetical protein EV176_003225 [Coemansia sp. RSA 451]|nr:hypothetical protein J3F82_006833 [Coemansia sp. RSA 637]KAJ2165532.1 hypothetical protein GGH15_003312 [Coemansia sp. RSA 562]KAJ2195288.1 hypothetical protein IW144_003531 [Coemansia sp. RSA 522]KAJ2257327.1 hypothetical protein GGH98_000929 [Coemansia sp. RSA 454]KAJ2273709.1 hypothetical protein EV176_003225 [Coemansia sp. RSA 451]KAJ2418784.1 hypothetical protein GGF47_004884 [Coemansia sp. RSA 2524]KAJ2549892.1 hypothetical protein IWW35_003551 [Coemansia sp. RSA 1878]KAJ2591222.1 h